MPFTKADPPSMISTIKSFFLFPELNDVSRLRPSLLGQGWTLIFEMYFYVIFALALSLFSTVEKRIVAVSLVMISIFTASQYLDKGLWMYVVGEMDIFKFIFGMLLAYIYLRVSQRTKKWLVYSMCPALVFMAYVCVFSWTEGDSILLQVGIPGFLVVAIMVLSKRIEGYSFPKISNLIGDASYSIYLSHGIGIIFFSILWKRDILLGPSVFGKMPLDIYFVIVLALIIAAGVVCYWLVERPVTKYLNLKFKELTSKS